MTVLRLVTAFVLFPAVLTATLPLPGRLGEGQAAEAPVYRSGPMRDAAYVRFVNGTAAALAVDAPGLDRFELPVQDGPARVSPFFSVTAQIPAAATLARAGSMAGTGAGTASVQVVLSRGEFATIVATDRGDGAVRVEVVRDLPVDFNALKASLAFFNFDPACADGRVAVTGTGATVFAGVGFGTVQRRSVNPVQAQLSVSCGPEGPPVPAAAGVLEAGGRYSILLMPAGDPATRALTVRDTRASVDR